MPTLFSVKLVNETSPKLLVASRNVPVLSVPGAMLIEIMTLGMGLLYISASRKVRPAGLRLLPAMVLLGELTYERLKAAAGATVNRVVVTGLPSPVAFRTYEPATFSDMVLKMACPLSLVVIGPAPLDSDRGRADELVGAMLMVTGTGTSSVEVGFPN